MCIHHLKLSLFTFLFWGCQPTNTSPPTPETAKTETVLPLDPAVTIGRLDNGLTYYIRENSEPKDRMELRLVINTGSILENEDQQGLAHFVEHMAFNGTEKFEKQELVDYLESIGSAFGPDLNAYTSFDETVYMLKVPTGNDTIVQKAFSILNEWAHAVSFNTEEIDKERGVVVEEWRIGQGAEARMRDKQFPVLFKGSQYAKRLPIGQKEIIETAAYETIKQFYKDWYRPDLMAVIVVGDFDKAEIESLIKSKFSQLKNPAGSKVRATFPVPNHSETLVTIASDPEAMFSMVQVYNKHPLRRFETESDYRSSIVESLYEGMINFRLQELTQKADPPFLVGFSAMSNLVRTKDAFMVAAIVKNNEIERGLETLLVESERVTKHGFNPSELARQKMVVMRQYEKMLNEKDKTSSKAFAGEYINHFLEDIPAPGIDSEFEMHQRFIPTITLDEINRLGEQYFTKENRVILAKHPEKAGIESPEEESLLAVFDKVKSMTIAPYEDDASDLPLLAMMPTSGSIISQDYDEKLNLTHWGLSNGVKVYIKPTDFKNDEITFTAYSPGGHSLIDDQNILSGIFASRIINQGGLGSFNKIALSKKMMGKIVRVSPYISSTEEGLNGSCAPQDLETLFQLIHLTFTEPRRDSTAYLSWKNQMTIFLSNFGSVPATVFQDTLSVTLGDYHPRSKPLSVERLEEVNLNRVDNFYRERFADGSDFTFFFVGNVDLETMKPLVEQYVSSLPAINREESWTDTGERYPNRKIHKEIFRGQAPQSQTAMVFTGPMEWNLKNRHRLRSMAQAFQIKLREVLREELGGTYGVGVNISLTDKPIQRYKLSISFGSNPNRTEELIQAVETQVDSLKSVGLSANYLQKVKETQRRSRETGLRENGFWLSRLKSYHTDNQPFDKILDYTQLIDALTVSDIQSAAQTVFETESQITVSLYPESFKK